MEALQNRQSQKQPTFVLGTLVVLSYLFVYLAKSVLSATLPQIPASAFDTEALGIIGSTLLLSYGLGQFFNGLLGDCVPPKWMVAVGLGGSGILLTLFPITHSTLGACFLFGGCGFLLSMIWGPVVRFIGETTLPASGKLILSLTSASGIVGNLGAFLLAFCSIRFWNWKVPFTVAGILALFCALVWFFVIDFLERKQTIARIPFLAPSFFASGKAAGRTIKPFFCASFLLMVPATMVNGVIRNAVSFWIPTILSDYLEMGPESATLVSILLPIVSLSITLSTVWFSRFFKNREGLFCTVLFAGTTAVFLLVPLLGARIPALSSALLFLSDGLMNGVSNIIFCIYILRFSKTGYLSGVSGFLDCVSYLAASAVSLVFSSVLADGNWQNVFSLISALTVLGAGVCFASHLAEKKQPAESEKQPDKLSEE